MGETTPRNLDKRRDAPQVGVPHGGKRERRIAFDYDHYSALIATIRAKQIFFIGGAMKSGTTWLQTLLNAHPDVSCSGEGHFPDQLAEALKLVLKRHAGYVDEKNRMVFSEIEGYPRFTDQHFFYIFASAVILLLAEQVKDRNVFAVGEKTPDNIRHFFSLHLVFPDAKFIHIVRDGRDCATSGWFHNLRSTPDWTRNNYASFEAYTMQFAEIWAAEVAAGSRFAASEPERCLTLRYEDLSAAPIETLGKAIAFLGVNAAATVVERCLSEGAFEKLSGGRQRGEENRGSFFRKGAIGDWRNHFTAEMTERFMKKAGAELARFGYT